MENGQKLDEPQVPSDSEGQIEDAPRSQFSLLAMFLLVAYYAVTFAVARIVWIHSEINFSKPNFWVAPPIVCWLVPILAWMRPQSLSRLWTPGVLFFGMVQMLGAVINGQREAFGSYSVIGLWVIFCGWSFLFSYFIALFISSRIHGPLDEDYYDSHPMTVGPLQATHPPLIWRASQFIIVFFCFILAGCCVYLEKYTWLTLTGFFFLLIWMLSRVIFEICPSCRYAVPKNHKLGTTCPNCGEEMPTKDSSGKRSVSEE